MIRAKFVVTHVTKHGDGSESINARPVYEGPDNESWSKWTPSGTLIMTISNPDAQGKLQGGKEYYLDFTEVA